VWALLFCAPALMLYSTFMVWPLVQSLRFALLDRAAGSAPAARGGGGPASRQPAA